MGITRLYTGPDGQTHIEELDLASHPELTQLMATKGVVFRSAEPGRFSDWHTAPRRQFVITLEGEVEIGLADGSVHRFGPGHVNLAEDLTGKGHTTRVVGNKPRVTFRVSLRVIRPAGSQVIMGEGCIPTELPSNSSSVIGPRSGLGC
jgi:hypothetical protein